MGTITAAKGSSVVVQLEDGTEVLCRSLKRLHRPLGSYSLPVGQWACIRYASKPTRAPLIVRVLPSDVECCFYSEASLQGDGRVDGHPFYFRARHSHWSFTVCTGQDIDPSNLRGPDVDGWFTEDEFVGFEMTGEADNASRMTQGAACAIITKCVAAFRNSKDEATP